MNCAGAIASSMVLAAASGAVPFPAAGAGAGTGAGLCECLERLASYERSWQVRPTKRIEIEATGGGRLLYLGAEHTGSASHRQFALWRREFERFEPTVVFTEGHDARTASTPDESVRRYGESGFVRFLARRAGITSRSLEPSVAREIRHVRGLYSDVEVQLHYVLREVRLLRDRTGASEQEVRAKIGTILSGAQLPQMPRPLRTIDEFEVAFRARWAFPKAWWDPPASWFNPLTSTSQSGGLFTNDVERASARFRDRAMVERLVEAVGAGERVFAVVGRGHLPMQAPALRCALGEAR